MTYTTSGGSGKTVLLVIAGSSPGTHEAARKSQFESWGYTVNTIQDSESQANFDTAVAASDVVYVSGSIQPWDLLYKLREASCGVISEVPDLDTEFGFTTNDGYTESQTQILNVDNSHAVTAGLATGSVSIVSSNQPLASNGNTIAAGMTKLGERSSGQLALGIIDTDGALANTYSSNSTANGRRVRMPWANITWSALNSNGLLIAQNALEWASDSSNGLVAYWKLNDASGTTAADDSGNSHDGTFVSDPSWSTGAPRNGGLHFNSSGSGDRVDAGSFDVSGNSLTLAAWVYIETASNDSRLIVKSDGNTMPDQSWGLTVDENGNADFRVNAGGSWDRVEELGIIQEGQWYHLLGTYDGTTMDLYVDGELVESKAHAVGGSIDTDSGKTVTLGDSVVGGRPLYGYLDDVRVYSEVLSEPEIAEVYGLIAHWKLDEASGATAVDSSLASNDATRTGTESWTSGVEDGGHDFDYTDGEEYFEAPSNTAMDDVQEGDYTVMAYFKPSSVPPGSGSDNDAQYGIISKSGYHMGLAYRNDQLFHMEHWTASGPTWSGVATWGTTYAPGRFYHVAGVVSVVNGTVKIYVDGELVETANFTPGEATREYSSEPWRIGTRNPGASSWSHAPDAVIDDVRIYNRALSAEELAGFDGTKLLAHWKLNETSGTTAADSASNFDGTYTNGPTLNQEGPYPADGAIAADFSGASGEKVALPSMDVDLSGGLTMAVWYRVDSLSGVYTDFFSLSNGSLVDDVWFGLNNSQGLELFLSDTADGASWRDLTESSGVPETGTWKHAVAVIDESGNAKLFSDGQVVATGYVGLPRQVARTDNNIAETAFDHTLDGRLFDVRLYNRPLSDAEVSDLYGLVGHWKMDEASGSTAADSTGYGNDATLSGATWSSDCSGNSALAFDGTGQTTATGSAFDPPEMGTVAFWYKSAGPTDSRQRPWGLGSDYEMWQDTDGLISFDVSTDGYQGGFITTEPLDEAYRWYHLVAQYDSDDDSYAIYINGELHKAGISTWNIQKQAANILTFGTRTGNTQYWEGELRDFRIYNRHLSDKEIIELSAAAGHWDLDETSGSLAADNTILSNDGSYVGMPSLGVSSVYAPENGSAVRFDGSTQYVTIPHDDTMLADNGTVMFWFRTDLPLIDQGLFSKDSSGFDTGGHLLVRLVSGKVNVRLQSSSQSHTVESPVVASTKWRHVTFTWGTSGMNLFIDGQLVGTNPSYTGGLGTTSGGAGNYEPIVLGASGMYSGNLSATPLVDYFSGAIDDVQFHARAFCQDEIYKIYRGGRSPGVRILKWVEVR